MSASVIELPRPQARTAVPLRAVPGGRTEHPPRPAPRRAAVRDGFLDAVRAYGTLVVIFLHWLIPVVAWDGRTLHLGNALSVGGGWALTWVVQVMPLMFFAAGAASRLGGGAPAETDPVGFLRRRLRRLLPPVLAFLGGWVLIGPVAIALGVPGAAVGRAARIAPQLLWFVAVLVPLLALTPLCVRLYRRFGAWRPIGVLAGAAVLVDVARFGTGVSWLGYVNVLCVWLVPYLLGIAYAEGGLRDVPRRTLLAVAGASLVVLGLLVGFGPYPASMVGLPGDTVSNMNPPTICLLAVTGFQLPLVLALRRPVLRALRVPVVSRVVEFVGARSMTLYLWHLTAMFLVVGVVLFGLGGTLPAPFGADWWATRLPWYAGLVLLLAVLVKVFGPAERYGSVRAVAGPAVRAALAARGAVVATGRALAGRWRRLAGYAGVACLLSALLLVICYGTLPRFAATGLADGRAQAAAVALGVAGLLLGRVRLGAGRAGRAGTVAGAGSAAAAPSPAATS